MKIKDVCDHALNDEDYRYLLKTDRCPACEREGFVPASRVIDVKRVSAEEYKRRVETQA